MKRKNLIMHCSLFVGMLGALTNGDAYAAVRIGNASRANQYSQQVAEQQRATKIASAKEIAQMSGNNEQKSGGVSAEKGVESTATANTPSLELCSQIYPNGEFEIARPTAGLGAGGAKTCVAVVELRGFQMGQNGEDAVLARVNVASGSAVNCNISDFPESSYLPDVSRVVFPADSEPTVQDVIKVMNKEQKQNAGLKIAASTLIGAVGGNLSGKNDVGKDGLFGTSKSQMTNTVVGAVGGAAIGAGSVYAGKVGGDVILSTGVNAAAGAVVGNIMAAGDSVLRIEHCKGQDGKDTGESCLWGYLVIGPELKGCPDTSDASDALCEDGAGTGHTYFIDLDDGKTVMRCDADKKNCTEVMNLVSIKVKGKRGEDDKPLEELERNHLDNLKGESDGNFTIDIDGPNMTKEMKSGSGSADVHTYRIITSAKIDNGAKKPALIQGFHDSTFGKKAKDWREWKRNNQNTKIFYRNTNGGVGDAVEGNVTVENFYPMYIDASDGSIVDLGNKARLKSTLIGAGAGGALGAFTAYQGAQNDIDERWVSAVREYKDSLQKFYCATGGRFLSYYNDVVMIPSTKE